MALSRTLIGSGTVTSNGAVVGPFTPAAGSVVYVVAAVAVAGGGELATADALSIDAGTTGLSFAPLGSPSCQIYGTRRGVVASAGTAGSPASGSITISFNTTGGGTFAAMSYAVIEYTGHDAGTPNDAVVQATDAGGATPLDLADVGTLDAGDEVLVIVGHEHASNSLAVTGGSEIFAGGEADHIRSFLTAAVADETPNITWSSPGGTGAMAFIINVGAAGPEVENGEPGTLAVTGAPMRTVIGMAADRA